MSYVVNGGVRFETREEWGLRELRRLTLGRKKVKYVLGAKLE